MCGINGIFAYTADAPPVDLVELRAVRDRMAARGPDGTGEWVSGDGRVGFGHRRLSIIDLRAVADQPMVHGNGRLRIVFNGEIYNYRDLRRGLAQEGAVFLTESDTEVLLHLWERRGPAMVDALRGMYTLAIWDDGKRGMFLARDPYGIKPLYLADDGRTLRFASSVKALLAGGRVDATPEPAGHAGFFLWGHVPEPWTLVRGVRSLGAGTSLWLDGEGAREERRFFELARVLREAGPPPATAAARQALLSEALHESVAHHLVADVPVGVFLSAGLDSTTIAALAAEAGQRELRTLTLGFEEFRDRPEDETGLAEIVARQLGAKHETRWVRGAEFAAERARLLDAMDLPSVDGVNTYFVARATRAAGLKVALSGVGGDELFASYPSFRQVPRLVRATAGLRPLTPAGAALRRLAAPPLGLFTSPKWAGLLEYGTSWSGAYLLRRSLFMPWEVATLLPPEIAREGMARLDPLGALNATVDALRNPRLIVGALESDHYMRSRLLRDSDWAGMAHSIEIRTPLVDAEVTRRLAPLLAAPDPPSKRDMAASPSRPLPRAILDRPKTGFVVPVREWVAAGSRAPERGLRGWARQVHAAFGGFA